MALRIWIALFIFFIFYSFRVYTNCDKDNKEGIPDQKVLSGWKMWQEKNCQSCHQIYGLGGYMGPDLTNVISEKDTKYVHTIIKYGTGKMPDYKLSDEEVNDLTLFLQWVNQSGKSRVPSEKVTYTGNYNLGN